MKKNLTLTLIFFLHYDPNLPLHPRNFFVTCFSISVLQSSFAFKTKHFGLKVDAKGYLKPFLLSVKYFVI